MVKAGRRKGKSRNAGGMGSEATCLVRDTVMVRADESEDVPFEPLSTAEEQEVSSSRPVRVYADGMAGLSRTESFARHAINWNTEQD
jgi:hypothetical protein